MKGGMFMYVYEHEKDSGLWTTGFYGPDGVWRPEHDCESPEEAEGRVAWLNGGAKGEEPKVIKVKIITGYAAGLEDRINEFLRQFKSQCKIVSITQCIDTDHGYNGEITFAIFYKG
jgi:hypothetical protein